jgi:hypothetical protein
MIAALTSNKDWSTFMHKVIEPRILYFGTPDEQLLVPGTKNYIDPEKWNPLIMNFREFFGLSGKIHSSRLEAAFYGLPRKKQAQEISVSVN